MPIKAAAFKALRQTKKHAERNKLAKLKLADARRAVRKALDSAEVKKAEEAVKTAIKMLDKAYSRGIMKLNTVARRKSRLMANLSKLAASKKK
ncbi:MAG: 30S ribosomal protein S20 [Patescibacteria group bacterium]